MRSIEVTINNQVVYVEEVKDHISIMRGRVIYRLFNIAVLVKNGLNCFILVRSDKGDVLFSDFAGENIPSKMNEPGFEEQPADYDEIIKNYKHDADYLYPQ